MTSATPQETIYFVYPKLDEIRTVFDIDDPPPVDELTEYLFGGRRNWVVRTYIELLRRGYPVRLVDDFPRGAICVVHVDDICTWDFAYSSYLVVVRADRPPVYLCEYSIVQTPVLASSSRTHYLTYWPQSGLTPRDLNRGSRVERI